MPPAAIAPSRSFPASGSSAERLTQRRFQVWLEAHYKINDNQAGFGKGYSTADELIKLTQSIFDVFECLKPKRSALVLLDFQCAYDRVWHARLAAKLARLDVPACVTRLYPSNPSRSPRKGAMEAFPVRQQAVRTGSRSGISAGPTAVEHLRQRYPPQKPARRANLQVHR